MDDRSEPSTPELPELSARKSYEPPAVEETAAFETLALACAFNAGGGSTCYFGGYSTS